MSLKTWNNGEKGEVVQAIIEANFKTLGRYLSKNVLSLSTSEREGLNGDYLSNGLVVYDTDYKDWFEYTNNIWVRKPSNGGSGGSSEGFVFDFSNSDWNNGALLIPYSSHLISHPTIQVFMLVEDSYESVFCDVSVDSAIDITLSTDFIFSGRVVIK